MWSGSEEGAYSRLTDVCSGVRVQDLKGEGWGVRACGFCLNGWGSGLRVKGLAWPGWAGARMLPTEGPSWGHPVLVLGAVSSLLEPSYGKLLSKIDKSVVNWLLNTPTKGLAWYMRVRFTYLKQFSSQEQLLYRNVQRFRSGLVWKPYRLSYHSTLVLRVIKKKKKWCVLVDWWHLFRVGYIYICIYIYIYYIYMYLYIYVCEMHMHTCYMLYVNIIYVYMCFNRRPQSWLRRTQ